MSESEIKWDVPVRQFRRYDDFTRTHTISLEGRAYGKAWVTYIEWDDAWGKEPPSGVLEDLHRKLCEGILRERAKGLK